MSKIEITKSFDRTYIYNEFIVYSNHKFKDQNIFHDIFFNITKDYISYNDLKDIINTIKSKSKSKVSIEYYDDRIEIFKPNKYIFPTILIVKK